MLAVLTLGGLVLFAGIGATAAAWLTRNEAADPPILRPLPDDRILTNLRDSTAPFIGSTEMPGGDHLMLRTDGRIARLDPVTGLFSGDSLPTNALKTPAVALAAECAPDSSGSEPAAGRCQDPGALHVLSQDGGVLRGETGLTGRLKWQILLSDKPWTGSTGKAVEQADVTSWAASASGDTTAVLAGNNGLALLDNTSGRWIIPDGQASFLAAAKVGKTRLVPDGEMFWILSNSGYGLIRNGRLEWSNDTALVLRDLTIAPDGQRLAIVEGRCRDGRAPDCLTISALAGINDLTPLAGEHARWPDLNQTGLRYAMLQGRRVVVLGDTGVYAYDQDQRSWDQLYAGRIDAWHSGSNGTLVFSSGPTVALVRNAAITRKEVADGGPFRQLALAGEFAIGLGYDGILRDLDSQAILRGNQDRLPKNTVFTNGTQRGTGAVLTGPEGVLLHDVEARHFKWISKLQLQAQAEVLLHPQARLLTLGSRIFVLNKATGGLHLLTIEGTHPDQTVTLEHLGQLRGPLRSMTQDQQNAWLVDARGVPYQLTAKGRLFRQIGPQKQGNAAEFRFVTAQNQKLTLATRQHLWTYNLAQRGWTGPLDAPGEGQFSDISDGSALFAMTPDSQVFRRSEDRWFPVLNGGSAAFSRNAVSDAATRGQDVLLGGQGMIQSYDPLRSAFGNTWKGGHGDVRIVDPNGQAGLPVWFSGGRLLHGGNEIVSQNLRGAWKVADGYLAELQRPGGQNFTAHFPRIPGNPTCTFLTAPAPTGKARDGVQLSNDRVLIATDRGWGIHDPSDRRWIELQAPPLRSDERLIRTEGFLVALSPKGIKALPLSQLRSPSSCAAPLIKLNWTVAESGISAAHDPASNRFAMLKADGRINEWSEGTLQKILSLSTRGPRQEELHAIARSGSTLVLAAADGIWRYEMPVRKWHFSAFQFPQGIKPNQVESVSFGSPGEPQLSVTLWLRSGNSLGGVYVKGQQLPLNHLGRVALPRVPMPAAEILDLSASGAFWAVGGASRIVYGKQDAKTLSNELRLEQGQLPMPHNWGTATAFVTGDPANPAGLAILPGKLNATRPQGKIQSLTYRYLPGSDRAYGMDGSQSILWRVASDGTLWKCPISAGLSAPQGCQEALAAPTKLRSEDVSQVWRDDGSVWVGARGDLLRFDNELRNPVAVPGPRIAGQSTLHRSAGNLLLLEEPGGKLWLLRDDAATQLATSVSQMVIAAGKLHLAADGLEFALDSNGQAIPPSVPNGSRAVTLNWYGTPRLSAIGDDGHILNGSVGRHFQVPPPNPETISAVIAHRQGTAWVQRRSGILDLLVPGTCDAGPHPGVQKSCLVSAFPRPISDRGLGRLLGISSDGITGSATLHLDGGTIALRNFRPIPETGTILPRRSQIEPVFSYTTELLAKIKHVPGHGSELDPVEQVSGTLASSTKRIGVAPPPSPWAALDLGWMKWQRNARELRFQSASGQIKLPPTQAIVSGDFLPARDGRAIAMTNGHAWLSPDALWFYPAGGSTPQLVTRHDGRLPQGHALGKYLLPDSESMEAASGGLAPDNNSQTLSLDDLSLTAALRSQTVTAQIKRTGGTPAAGFAARGFSLDQRRGLAYLDGQLFTSTPAGFINAAGLLQNSESFPGQAPPVQLAATSAGVSLKQGGSWIHRNAPAQWSTGPDPLLPRQFATAAGRIWTLGKTGLDVTSPEPWRTDRRGLAFEMDRFVSVAGSPDSVVLLTGLGSHELATAHAIRGASRADSPSARAPLDMLSVRPGHHIMFDASRSRQVWQRTTKSWQRVAGDRPWQKRTALQNPDLRLTLTPGRNLAERRITSPGGQNRWAEFDWNRGRAMPFDRARSISATADALWIGTDFGLRRFSALGLASAALFDVSNAITVPPVTRIGRPEASPDRLLATTSAGDCLQLLGTQASASCQNGDSLNRRHVLSDTLWHWVETDQGAEGHYPVQGSPGLSAQLTQANTWPHDDLSSWGLCGGGAIELWNSQPILRTGPTTLRLQGTRGLALHCQTQTASLEGGASLPRGRYLAGAAPLRETGPGLWSPVPSGLGRAVNMRHRGELAYEANRLRILTGPLDVGWQNRTLSKEWRPLSWRNGLPALDTTLGFAVQGNQLRRVTPAGVIEEDRTVSGLQLNTQSLLLENANGFNSFANCIPARVELADGNSHAIPKAPGAPLRILCSDGQIHTEQPGQHDLGAFHPGSMTLFSPRPLIEANGWEWKLSLAKANSPGHIEASFKDEAMSLSSGRFAMDSFTGIAAPFRNRTEVVSLDGWRSHRLTQFSATSGSRPGNEDEARAVTALTIDRDEDNAELRLCTLSPAGARLEDENGPVRAVDACKRWQGAGRFWQYRDHLDAVPEATGVAANGPRISREITAGRFSDLIATGLPQPAADVLLVPTRTGILSLNRSGRPDTQYSFPEIRGLFLDQAQNPVIIDGRKVMTLNGHTPFKCAALPALLAGHSESSLPVITLRGNLLQALAAEPGKLLRPLTIDCTQDAAEQFRAELAISDRPRFAARMRNLPQVTGRVQLQKDGGKLILSDGLARSVSLPVNKALGPLLNILPAVDGRSMVVLFRKDVMQFDTDAAISALSLAPLRQPAKTDPKRMSARPAPPQSGATMAAAEQQPSVPSAKQVPVQAPPVPTRKIAKPNAAGIVPLADYLVQVETLTREQVFAIQTVLKAKGHYRLRVDGLFGPGTRAAITRYQAEQLQPETGLLTQQQLELLLEELKQ